MPTTPNMGLVLPTEDASSDVWDTLLNTALTAVDGHDHSDGNGVLIPTAGIEIDADLPYAGFAATGLKAVDFNSVAPISSGYLTSLFVSSADNELYWRTSGGVNVKVTSGTSLNSALLGGFTGDYGSGDEEASYSSSSKIYNFLQDTDHRGLIDASDLRLFENSAGVTNAVKLKSPAALAASYTITLPAALPTGTTKAPLFLSSTGVVTASNDVQEHWLDPSEFYTLTDVLDDHYDGDTWKSDGTNDITVAASLRLPVGARLLSVTVYGKTGNLAGEELEADLESTVAADGTVDQVSTTKTAGTGGTHTNIGWTTADTDLTPNGYTILTGRTYRVVVRLTLTSAAGEVQLYGVKVTWDRPYT